MRKIHLPSIKSYSEEQLQEYKQFLWDKLLTNEDLENHRIKEILKRIQYVDLYLKTKEVPRRPRYWEKYQIDDEEE